VNSVGDAALGAVWVAGNFAGRMSLDAQGTRMVTAVSGQSLFAAKMDFDGRFVTGTDVPVGATQVFAYDVSGAADGSVYLGGVFTGGAIPEGPGPGARMLASSGAIEDGYLLKLGPDAKLAWGRAYGGVDADGVSAVAALPDGGVLAAGHFDSPSVDFNPQPGGAGGDRRERSGGTEFLTRLGADGSYRGTLTVGQPSLVNTLSFRSLRVQAAGGLGVGGIFAGSVDFDPRTPEVDYKMGNAATAFVSRYLVDR
jgi:hypothetical protein